MQVLLHMLSQEDIRKIGVKKAEQSAFISNLVKKSFEEITKLIGKDVSSGEEITISVASKFRELNTKFPEYTDIHNLSFSERGRMVTIRTSYEGNFIYLIFYLGLLRRNGFYVVDEITKFLSKEESESLKELQKVSSKSNRKMLILSIDEEIYNGILFPEKRLETMEKVCDSIVDSVISNKKIVEITEYDDCEIELMESSSLEKIEEKKESPILSGKSAEVFNINYNQYIQRLTKIYSEIINKQARFSIKESFEKVVEYEKSRIDRLSLTEKIKWASTYSYLEIERSSPLILTDKDFIIRVLELEKTLKTKFSRVEILSYFESPLVYLDEQMKWTSL